MKQIRIARKLIADIYDELMKDIPTIPEDETLDEQVDREMDMQMETGTTEEEDVDLVTKALRKKYDIQSEDLTDILDEIASRRDR